MDSRFLLLQYVLNGGGTGGAVAVPAVDKDGSAACKRVLHKAVDSIALLRAQQGLRRRHAAFATSAAAVSAAARRPHHHEDTHVARPVRS